MYLMVLLSSSVITFRAKILYFVRSPSGIGHLILSPHFYVYPFAVDTVVLIVLNTVHTRNHTLPPSNEITEPCSITQTAYFPDPCSFLLCNKEGGYIHLPLSVLCFQIPAEVPRSLFFKFIAFTIILSPIEISPNTLMFCAVTTYRNFLYKSFLLPVS